MLIDVMMLLIDMQFENVFQNIDQWVSIKSLIERTLIALNQIRVIVVHLIFILLLLHHLRTIILARFAIRLIHSRRNLLALLLLGRILQTETHVALNLTDKLQMMACLLLTYPALFLLCTHEVPQLLLQVANVKKPLLVVLLIENVDIFKLGLFVRRGFDFLQSLFVVRPALRRCFVKVLAHQHIDFGLFLIFYDAVEMEGEKKEVVKVFLAGPVPKFPLVYLSQWHMQIKNVIFQIELINKTQIAYQPMIQPISNQDIYYILFPHDTVFETMAPKDKEITKQQRASTIQLHFISIIQFFSIKIYNNNNKGRRSRMGNDQPQTRTSASSAIDIQSPHLMLNNCKHISVSKSKYLLSEWNFLDQKDYLNWQKRYSEFLEKIFGASKYEQVSQPVFKCLFLPFDHRYNAINYCSSNGVVTMSYEMIDESLVKDIQSRALNNYPYTQHELWTILLILITTTNHLHQRQSYIGDIRPENIFIAAGGLKIATQNSWILQQSLRNKLMNGVKMFLTDESLSILNNRQLPFQIGKSNDGFAIGMTLAECILLQDLSDINTDHHPRSINLERHSNIVSQLLNIKYYPLKLLVLVVGMIDLDPDQRFTCDEAYRCLNMFKSQISGGKQVSLGKDAFKRCFGHKYAKLKDILINHKKIEKGKLFKDGDLSLSFQSSRINGISTVQMMKRTQNDTFNLSFFDLSGTGAQNYKASRAESNNNKSWATAEHKKHFGDRKKNSNVLDQYYNNSYLKNLNNTSQKVNSTLKVRTNTNKKDEQSPMMLQSEVKQMTFHYHSGEVIEQQSNKDKDKEGDRHIDVNSSNKKKQGREDGYESYQKVSYKIHNINKQFDDRTNAREENSGQKVPQTTNNSIEDGAPDIKVQDEHFETINFSFDEARENNQPKPHHELAYQSHCSKQRYNASLQPQVLLAQSIIFQQQSNLQSESRIQFKYSKSSKKVLSDLDEQNNNMSNNPLQRFLSNLRGEAN